MVLQLNEPLAGINISVKVRTTQDKIAKDIATCVRDRLNSALAGAEPRIKGRLVRMVAQYVRSSPTYLELARGVGLYHELGDPNPVPGLENMIDLINLTHDFKFSRFRRISTSGVKGRLQVKFIDDQWEQVITSEGKFVSEPSGSEIEWLRWLLKEGDKIIVRNWDFVLGGRQFSRTGEGLMRENISRGWRVPPGHSGTPRNNFVTRAIDENFNKVVAMVEKELFKAL